MADTSPAVPETSLTGFYRCTDILYNYYKSLPNSRDAVQLQKLLSRDSILHPSHPLAAADGVVGIQSYIGTFPDGQARLLFTSRQTDFLRYWMHAMKLTENLIPLPYSDCMFVASSVSTVEPIVLENLAALSYTSKKFGRQNQYLLEHPRLVPRRAEFERARALWAAKRGVWCAINFAAWEADHTAISDVGYSLVRWDPAGTEVIQHGHFVVKENQVYSKTHAVEGNFELLSKSTLKRKLDELFAQLSQHAPLFIVSNESKGDIKYLRSKALDVPLPGLASQLPDSAPSEGLFVVDTSELFSALTGSDADTPQTLQRICKHLLIDMGELHNAGTNAQHILDALRSMASGAPLDVQREARWPEQTELQVQFNAWDNDPNHADLEGILPPLNKS